MKLLRVIQEKEVERIGGNRSYPLNMRIIAATNQDLEELVRKGKFRQDLYYRLNVIEIRIPPLCKRKDDIPVLVYHLVQKFGGGGVNVSPRAMLCLKEYDWPGNVRELQNVLEHACIMRIDNMIDVMSFPQYMRPDAGTEAETVVHAPNNYDLKEMTAVLEKDLIQEALKKYSNKSKAIKALGISRSSFYEKVKKYNIEVDMADAEK